MSKNKDVEKKLEKEIEKALKPEKEFEKRKELKQEIKETKEFKEFKDKIEIKERIKDFKELKEFKEFEKRVPDKGGKEIVEGGGFDPGIVFRAEKPEEGAAAAQELKQIEKIKPEKEFPDKIQKEIEKIKPEKEFEKFHKEAEKIKPEKEFPEKFQVKPEFEKLSIETKLDPGTRLFKGAGSPEERLGELEDAVERLTHFIGVDLRPDLTTGALKGEPDVGGEAKTDDKKKPK